MLFRAPELFHVDSHCIVDEKVDVWVRKKEVLMYPVFKSYVFLTLPDNVASGYMQELM